ncbi:MAG: hypothetical protein U1E25_01020 [Methylocystis sp.]
MGRGEPRRVEEIEALPPSRRGFRLLRNGLPAREHSGLEGGGEAEVVCCEERGDEAFNPGAASRLWVRRLRSQ